MLYRLINITFILDRINSHRGNTGHHSCRFDSATLFSIFPLESLLVVDSLQTHCPYLKFLSWKLWQTAPARSCRCQRVHHLMSQPSTESRFRFQIRLRAQFVRFSWRYYYTLIFVIHNLLVRTRIYFPFFLAFVRTFFHVLSRNFTALLYELDWIIPCNKRQLTDTNVKVYIVSHETIYMYRRPISEAEVCPKACHQTHAITQQFKFHKGK